MVRHGATHGGTPPCIRLRTSRGFFYCDAHKKNLFTNFFDFVPVGLSICRSVCSHEISKTDSKTDGNADGKAVGKIDAKTEGKTGDKTHGKTYGNGTSDDKSIYKR